MRIISGKCPNISLARGYTRGDGHLILSSSHGLADDDSLEWEVVTSQGQHLLASSMKYVNLYFQTSTLLKRGGNRSKPISVSLNSLIKYKTS
jgi:hypothetical protein